MIINDYFSELIFKTSDRHRSYKNKQNALVLFLLSL